MSRPLRLLTGTGRRLSAVCACQPVPVLSPRRYAGPYPITMVSIVSMRVLQDNDRMLLMQLGDFGLTTDESLRAAVQPLIGQVCGPAGSSSHTHCRSAVTVTPSRGHSGCPSAAHCW